MSITELLPWLNAAIIPAIYYIARLERRLMKMEILIGLHMGIDEKKLNEIGG